jgi:hypothetical protein
LLRCRLLLVELLTLTACLPTINKHDIQLNAALAIVRTSAPLETPLALKLSATAVVESERIASSLFFLGTPTYLPSSPLCVFTQSPPKSRKHGSCPFLFCRFKNFSPETLVTFLLRLCLLQIIMLYAFMTFFLLA